MSLHMWTRTSYSSAAGLINFKFSICSARDPLFLRGGVSPLCLRVPLNIFCMFLDVCGAIFPCNCWHLICHIFYEVGVLMQVFIHDADGWKRKWKVLFSFLSLPIWKSIYFFVQRFCQMSFTLSLFRQSNIENLLIFVTILLLEWD